MTVSAVTIEQNASYAKQRSAARYAAIITNMTPDIHTCWGHVYPSGGFTREVIEDAIARQFPCMDYEESVMLLNCIEELQDPSICPPRPEWLHAIIPKLIAIEEDAKARQLGLIQTEWWESPRFAA